MTNPNNAVGTNGAFGGRTSVNAFNDVLGAFQNRGVLSGWKITPSSGMTVSVGGDGTTRDVAVAEDASGNKTTINNISGSPISVTLDSAPASNARYDAIVVYVDKPPVNSDSTQDNPECCGIIPVAGTAASSPSYPSDATIRSAITADGASGATAYYAVVGHIRVASGTTNITSGMITAGPYAGVGTNQISDGAVTSDKIDWTTIGDTLYTSDSGSAISTSIPLDGNLYNYQRVKVIFSSNANRYATAEIVSPSSGQYWPLSILFTNGSTMVVRSATYRTYSNSLSFIEYNGKILGSDGSVTSESTNFIKVHKVIGYK